MATDVMEPMQGQKADAVGLHSEQAELFASRYRDLPLDAYKDCFSYSRKRLQVVLDRYLPADGHGQRLLDVGCGTGHHLAELRARGFDGAGVDGSADMLEQAAAVNPGVELRLADVEHLPFADASFDIVVCIEVLRYLPSPAACLREMARVLRPGGICLATATPLFNLNGYWLVNRLAHLVRPRGLVHLKQYFATAGGLRRDCRAAGFAAPTIHGVYCGPINWVERLAKPALPRLLRRWEPIDAALSTTCWPDLANMFLIHAVRRAEVSHGRP